MAELVIQEFTAKKIPILCIHDSFVVQNQFEDLLCKAMGKAWAIIAKDMTGELERSGSKIKKAQLEKQWEEIRGNNYEVTSFKMGQREFDKLAKVYGFEKDEKGNMVRTSPTQHGNERTQIIKEQMYLDKLAEKAEPEYKRRWTSHPVSSKTRSDKQLMGFLSIQCGEKKT